MMMMLKNRFVLPAVAGVLVFVLGVTVVLVFAYPLFKQCDGSWAQDTLSGGYSLTHSLLPP